MKKTINGTTYKTDLSTDDCNKCDAQWDDDLCGNLCRDNKTCVNNIWRKVKMSKKKLKKEIAKLEKTNVDLSLVIARNKRTYDDLYDQYNELFLKYTALQKVHDLNESSLNTCERELHYRDRFDLDVADFVARIIEKVVNKEEMQ